jgi:outer membrane protein TolC
MKKQSLTKITILLWGVLSAASLAGQETDSLSRYLRTAAENNPSVEAAFYTYEAALQKVPQMGAYDDPQLDMGFFLEPMTLVDGRQLAQFQVMQMFPWFGTKKSARTEAQHMAKMAFEQFRETRDNLYLEVYTQWYALCALRQKLGNTEENIALLKQLEALALRKFSSGNQGALPSGNRPAAGNSEPAAAPASMPGMSMGGTAPATAGGSGDAGGMAMTMGSGGASGGMSEVLRIQLEIVELESAVESLHSELTAGKARFNALLNRPAGNAVVVPDSLAQLPFLLDVENVMQTVGRQNPMLGMIQEETLAYRARLEMEKKMGYPMFGVGLQYMLIGKNPESAGGTPEMGAMDAEMNGGAMKSMNGKDMFMPMVSVSIPLYRNKYKAAQRENRFLQQANEAKYADTYNRLEAQLHQFRHQLDDAQRKMQLYQKQSALAHTTCELVIQEFVTGKSDLGAVIQVQRQLLDYELKKMEAVAAYNTLVANIRKMISVTNEY